MPKLPGHGNVAAVSGPWQHHRVAAGGGRTVLIVVAHADDVALFLGGTVATWADHGWRVVVARVTDDGRDSFGMDLPSTIAANTAEFAEASAILGVAETVELGYPTDMLGDVSEVELRERCIRLARTYRPYALVSFDPYAMYGEDNQDHIRLAAAVDESFWTSQFDLHHPEHFAEGLAPHGCFERWYFGRRVTAVTDVVDITPVLARKVDAACAHRTMMTNYFHQLQLQAATGGWDLPEVDDCLRTGDPRPVLEELVTAASVATGQLYGLGAAEVFRVVRFNGLEQLLHARGRRRTS